MIKQSDKKCKCEDGFTLIEVILSMLILSIIVMSAMAAFIYASDLTRENRLKTAAINLANKTVEHIRSLQFAEVGTKLTTVSGTIYGDPPGEIEQNQVIRVDGIDYTVETVINWEEEGNWAAGGDADWDYKSVKVTVVAKSMKGNPDYTESIETYVTRDSTQPPLIGANIRVRAVRGWNLSSNIPVSNVKFLLKEGPSAPRIVFTGSTGAARFIGLTPGNYKVVVDPSGVNMILNPSQSLEWPMSLSNMTTLTNKFEIEYPCGLDMTLTDISGNSVTMDSTEIATIKLQVPNGGVINKGFTGTDLDSNGNLPHHYINGLWPVGTGYPGMYHMTDIDMKGYQYVGCYELSAFSEEEWDGTFSGPGTDKKLKCYFIKFPDTPEESNLLGVSSKQILAGNFHAGYANGVLLDAKIFTGNNIDTLTQEIGTISSFTAQSIYFDNTGTAGNAGLSIKNNSCLTLHTKSVIFHGKIRFDNNPFPTQVGKIILRANQEDGSLISGIDGSQVGGVAETSYGKLYLQEPLLLGDNTVIGKGAYYFYDGLKLPENASELIPITKENYIE